MATRDAARARVGKAVMKLPNRALRRMAGEPVVVDGRTLDVRIQLAAKASAEGPAMSELDPETGRDVLRAGVEQFGGRREPGVAVRDRVISSHGLGVRTYHPPAVEGLSLGMLFMHQGGFVIGDLDTCDAFCSRVAAELGAVVVSVDYRLGPEHRFPAPSEDADTAWAWMNDHAEGLGIDTNRLVVCGDSAGGQMAAALCQRLRDAGRPQPAAQVLVYPLVDASATAGSMVTCADSFPLSVDTMEWFYDHSLPAGFDRSDPRLSPALAPVLGAVAPAVVVTAGFDPLRDQGIGFALALREAGVHVVDRCEDSLAHSFLAFSAVTPEADAAIGRLITDIDALI